MNITLIYKNNAPRFIRSKKDTKNEFINLKNDTAISIIFKSKISKKYYKIF